MRVIPILMAGAALASCTDGPPPRTGAHGAEQREYQQLLTARSRRPPISCLPHYRSGDMRSSTRIRSCSATAAAGSTSRTCRAAAAGLASGSNALVTRQFGSADLCRGDIAQVVDTFNRLHGRQLRVRRLRALRNAGARLALVERVEALAVDFAR